MGLYVEKMSFVSLIPTHIAIEPIPIKLGTQVIIINSGKTPVSTCYIYLFFLALHASAESHLGAKNKKLKAIKAIKMEKYTNINYSDKLLVMHSLQYKKIQIKV